MQDYISALKDEIKKKSNSFTSNQYSEYVSKLEDAIINLLKSEIKENTAIAIDTRLSSLLDDSGLKAEDITESKINIQNILEIYSNLKTMIDMGDRAISFLQECTQKYVVFNDFKFLENYANYGFDSKNHMQRVSAAVKNVYFTHVSNRLAPSSAEAQVIEMFDFPENIAHTYSSLYELNYDRITMNVILQFQTQNS